ncbi:hypothetical protein ACHAXA_001152 [Cyclostephanos tholiformis]|uniref:Uncharacterized protein n=1 Tax=Cyclostephanos tholiformis TaxID=382380 RepID=A0ABD3RCN9_9STRA
MTTETTTITDNEGRCPSHPFVELSRLSPRTGEWKILMNSCPLCFMDGMSKAIGVLSKESNADRGEGHPLIFDGIAPAVVAKVRQKSLTLPSPPSPPPPPPTQRRSHIGSSRRGSRVRFQPDKDVIFTATTSMLKGKSVLRASPKYKVCEEMMQQQLDESVRVTTMSMDLPIDIDDEDSKSSFANTHDQKEHNRQKDLQHKEEKQLKDETNHTGLSLQLGQSARQPFLCFPCANEYDSIANSAANQEGIDDEPIIKSLLLQNIDDQRGGTDYGRRSYRQAQLVGRRPDPEEYPTDNISGGGSCAPSQNRRSQRNSLSQHRRSSSQQRRGRARLEGRRRATTCK